ncbi:sugar ABC transporter substrate-binding protein [Clostridia bacterium]|nr:sugar ABC transporter substrate-binding protein [Clostridia bacterium]
MRLRNFLSIILALTLMLALLSGCAVAQTAEPVEVVIWHTFTNDQDATLNAIADAFNASQTAAVVKVQSQPYSGFLGNVQSAVANGVGPNIIFNYASTAAEYVEEGLVVDISKYIDDPEVGIPGFKDSLPAGILAEAYGFVDGRMHAWPLVTTGPILFYNKTLYDELGLAVPTTWSELAANSKAIFEAKGIPGYGEDSLVDTIQSLILQSGGGYIDVEAKKVLWNTPEVVERLEWFVDNVKAGYFSITPVGDYYSTDYNGGQVGSYGGSCAGVPYIDPIGFESATAPVPSEGPVDWYPSWNRGIIIFSANAADVKAGNQEAVEKASYEFAKFYASTENNAKWCESMVAISPYAATTEVASYQAFVEQNPALADVAANLVHGGTLPNVTGSAVVRTELSKAITLAAGGQLTVAEALAEAEQVCNDALQGK